jgi:hypothetical protein
MENFKKDVNEFYVRSDAIYSTDEVIATQQRCHEKQKPVSKNLNKKYNE